MANESNPFKAALEQQEGEFDNPFRREMPNLTKQQQTRTVADLQLVKEDVLQRVPKVADLTVRDLNDLAAEFSGIPTKNPKVAELSLEDIQDIESVFFEFKVAAGRDLAQLGRNDLAAVDVSCCCCTPCCCCAATDMSETA